MIPDDETCESCGVAVHPDDLVRTADDVVLHRACAREIWPLAHVGIDLASKIDLCVVSRRPEHRPVERDVDGELQLPQRHAVRGARVPV